MVTPWTSTEDAPDATARSRAAALARWARAAEAGLVGERTLDVDLADRCAVEKAVMRETFATGEGTCASEWTALGIAKATAGFFVGG